MVYYLLATAILLTGIAAAVVKKNLIKIIIGLLITEYAVNLMLILVAYKRGGAAPILTPAGPGPEAFVDPLPQALILTSIVIGLAMAALMVALCLRLYQRYKTLDIDRMRKLRG
ncbi:MAG: sodium:proton antiporter [Planctomycetota bacterium]